MENIKTAELEEANVENANEPKHEKKNLLDAIGNAKPVKFVRKHWKGFVAGAAVAVAAGAATVAAKNSDVLDVPALDGIGDAVGDAVDTVTDTVA